MATNTTNFGLVKPAYSDTADIADINGNMDKVDVSLNGLADAIAIVSNNNTHVAITKGQYVYVHGHGSLAEGLYTAKSNIAANATLSTSNLQADGSGGLNALESNVVHKTGDETVGGQKTFSGYVNINSGRYKSLFFQQNGDTNGNVAAIEVDAGTATNQTTNRMVFYEYSPKTTASPDNTGFYERYRLPTPATGMSSNATYYLLTTKENAVADNLTTNSSTNVLSAKQGKVLGDKFSTVEDKKVTRIGSYFTERDAFKARRVGNAISVLSYIQITTQVPASTQFADIGFSDANGMFIFMTGDGAKARVVSCLAGKLAPDTAIPTGYYYCVGSAVTLI